MIQTNLINIKWKFLYGIAGCVMWWNTILIIILTAYLVSKCFLHPLDLRVPITFRKLKMDKNVVEQLILFKLVEGIYYYWILSLHVLTMLDQNEKSRCKLLIYNDFLTLFVNWLGLEPRTLPIKIGMLCQLS